MLVVRLSGAHSLNHSTGSSRSSGGGGGGTANTMASIPGLLEELVGLPSDNVSKQVHCTQHPSPWSPTGWLAGLRWHVYADAAHSPAHSPALTCHILSPHARMQEMSGILQTLCFLCREKDPELQSLIAQAIANLVRGDQVRSRPPRTATRTAIRRHCTRNTHSNRQTTTKHHKTPPKTPRPSQFGGLTVTW